MNLIKRLIEITEKRPKNTAIKYFRRGHLYQLNWQQTFDRIEQIYQSEAFAGVQPGDNIAIFSDTCKEWGFLDLAIMAHQAVTVPIYHSSHIDDINAILEDSEPKMVFVQNEALYEKLKNSTQFSKIKKVVAMTDFACEDEGLFRLKEMVSNKVTDTGLKDAQDKPKIDDLATIIFTSGTSGRPKGVMLSHRQIQSAVKDVFPLFGVTHNDSTLTFLPYSHVLGRVELWGHYHVGYCIGYAQSIDRIKANLLEVKPTVIVAVPRIFEKIYFGVKAQVEISKLKQGIFDTALKIGKTNSELRLNKKAPSLLQALKSQLAHRLVFSNIQEKLGGNLRFAVSGGAPLDPEIGNFFSACGITVLEGYGLTETTAPVFVNTLFEHKIGTVGKAVGDVEAQLAEDNEILIKSDKVMIGYYKNEQATKDAFTDDGFFKTGDIGEFDEEGYLRITDRKKDLIKTAGGKFVAPQKLQNLFATHPLISHIHVHGDKKKYIVALMTLDKDEVFRLKNNLNLASDDYEKIVQSKIVLKEVRKAVADINSQLASFETIKRFHVLDHDFSIEGGQLTPSLKMKRKKIDQIYTDEIEGLYR